VAEALSRLPGVNSHSTEQIEGRTRVRLAVTGNDELRPEIFRLANERQWVLWELHRGQASLEQLFRELTAGADEAGERSAEAEESSAEAEEPSAEAEERSAETAAPSAEDTEAES
jgi:peptidoglycan hydrolase CwlO-like protein